MNRKPKLSDAAKLERFQIALTNAMTDAAIAEALSRFGLSTESLEEGKALLAATREAYELANSRRRKRTVVYAEFNKQKEALTKLYLKHRKMAKIVFEENREVYERLGLRARYRTTYVNWIEMLKNFYSQVGADNGIKEQLAKLNITVEELDAAASAIASLEKARADYMIEKGASQDSTDAKNIAFAKMDDWMAHFFDLSKVAFRKQPQLMESFGVVVKN
jgi:Arc/MetJ family transcription regulator